METMSRAGFSLVRSSLATLFVTMSRLKKNLMVNLSRTTQWLLHHDHLLPSGRWRGTVSVSGEPEGKVVAIVCLVSPSLGGRFYFFRQYLLVIDVDVLKRGLSLSRQLEWCCTWTKSCVSCHVASWALFTVSCLLICLPCCVFGSSVCRRGVFLFVVCVTRVATGKESACRPRVPMTADGIRLTPNPFACLDAEREMEEDRSPDTPTYLDGPAGKGRAEVSFRQLEAFFKLVPLPRDNELKEKFDMGSNLLLGDPIPLGGQDVPAYETRAPAGFVGWNALFSHLISLRDQVIVCDTVYILVDNRDLSNLRNAHGIVPHWPPAAAWWASRVQLVGPFRERTDVVSIRICEATGLANVHPTWAGTFVLAGMVALYPHIHFALIDNDCLPLTLFEVAELWNLASPERVPIGSHSADREEPTRKEDDAGMQQTGYPHKRGS